VGTEEYVAYRYPTRMFVYSYIHVCSNAHTKNKMMMTGNVGTHVEAGTEGFVFVRRGSWVGTCCWRIALFRYQLCVEQMCTYGCMYIRNPRACTTCVIIYASSTQKRHSAQWLKMRVPRSPHSVCTNTMLLLTHLVETWWQH